MTTLAELMKGRVEDLVKGPKPLPIGDYPGVIKKFELPPGFQGKDGKTYQKLRVWASISAWAEGIEEDQKEGIEISNRQVPCDYFLPVGRDYALLAQQCGITGEITEQTNYQLVGSPVLACVVHEVDKKGQVWAKAAKLIGTK